MMYMSLLTLLRSQILPRLHNALVPFLRPAIISSDLCRDDAFISHFIQYLLQNSIKCDYIALLRPTSPMNFSWHDLRIFAISEGL